jgi:murein L,D-transpeptidase YafK
MKKFLKILSFLVLLLFIYYIFPEKKLNENVQIDKIVVNKSKRELLVFSNNNLLKSYTISLGKSPDGDKQFEGDNKTPEGIYFINGKNSESGYHKSIAISYPNNEDRKYANKIGKSPGGDIKIHGIKNGFSRLGKFHRWIDWTKGCIAVKDDEIEELYKSVKIGTPIEINP